MELIPITAVPNQRISFNVDGAYWEVRIYQAISHMCADVSRSGVALINGVRCFGGMPLLPYPYLYEPSFGNFIFDTDADWTQFGSGCKLYYLDAQEFSEYKALSFIGAVV